MKTSVHQTKQSRTESPQLIRMILELQIELGKFTKGSQRYDQELNNDIQMTIQSLDLILERITNG